MKILLSALVLFSLAIGSPNSSHAAEAKAPAKPADTKKQDKPAPGPEKKKEGNSTNTSDAFKFRGN